jgi:hypothetical protein
MRVGRRSRLSGDEGHAEVCRRPWRQRAREKRIEAWASWASRLSDNAGTGGSFAAFFVALYALATLGQQDDVPKGFWAAGHSGVVALVGLGVLAGIGSFVVMLSVKGPLARAKVDSKLITHCTAIAWLLEEKGGIPRGGIGVHVWEIAGPPWAQRLRLRASFRVAAGEGTPVLWIKGKGAVGQCWASPKRDELSDLAKLRREGPDQARFCDLSATDRFNMNWQEFSHGGAYDLIWVRKLYVGVGTAPRVWGMVSVDIAGDVTVPVFEEMLKDQKKELVALLDLCERQVG